MIKTDYDLVIIGAGPAGKRTDLAFQRWHSECVELLDYAEAFLDNEDKQVE